jgi:hypothetical protein
MDTHEPWWRAAWRLWLAVALLVGSLLCSALDWHVIGELTLDTTCRVVAGLIAVGRTIERKEHERPRPRTRP